MSVTEQLAPTPQEKTPQQMSLDELARADVNQLNEAQNLGVWDEGMDRMRAQAVAEPLGGFTVEQAMNGAEFTNERKPNDGGFDYLKGVDDPAFQVKEQLTVRPDITLVRGRQKATGSELTYSRTDNNSAFGWRGQEMGTPEVDRRREANLHVYSKVDKRGNHKTSVTRIDRQGEERTKRFEGGSGSTAEHLAQAAVNHVFSKHQT